ncbi:hypothetical protein DFH06DRAFT_1328224 [Mycena polygramma]|nr:hypothetical protein DFH06DRAFT_1328224 [Mycena polygramma]
MEPLGSSVPVQAAGEIKLRALKEVFELLSDSDSEPDAADSDVEVIATLQPTSQSSNPDLTDDDETATSRSSKIPDGDYLSDDDFDANQPSEGSKDDDTSDLEESDTVWQDDCTSFVCIGKFRVNQRLSVERVEYPVIYPIHRTPAAIVVDPVNATYRDPSTQQFRSVYTSICIDFVIPLTYSASSLLSTLTQRCPELRDVSIGAKYPAGLVQWNPSDWRAVSCFVLGIQHITALSVEYLQQDALEHLAELTTLKSLHLKNPLDLQLPVTQPPRTLPFPALRELKISCNLPRIEFVVQLLQMFQDLPLRGFDLAFDCFNAAELRSILEAMSLRVSRSSLRRFTIMFESDCPAEIDPALHVVPPDTVCLLCYFESLTCLSLTTGPGFDLDDDTILQLARAWPLIEILEMSTKIHAHSPRTTSACLLAFARHFPHLSSLSMVFDATTTPVFNPGTHTQQKCLHYLDVQHSPIANAFDMAQILSRVFPNLQQLETAYSWMEHFDDMELPVHDQRWKEVQTVLPHFLKVREEERFLLMARLSE